MQSNRHLDFSVIIPALNEEYYIEECLESLKNQDYKGNFEIIVVNNGSKDRTSLIAEKYGVRVLYERKRGIPYALITGCEKARGDILAFTDADTILPPYWLSRLNELFDSNPNAIGVGGPVKFYDAEKIIGFLTNGVFRPLFFLIAKTIIFPYSPFLIGTNMAVKKEVYQKSGGFNPRFFFGQDVELCKRIRKYGKIIFNDEITVNTSFRRFAGGYRNPILISLNAIKELFVSVFRFIGFYYMGRIYPAQKPIRMPPQNVNSFGGENRRRVALTFDDGPYGETTEAILDILKRKNTKATFFVIGKNARRYPGTVKRIAQEGHIIGNHSFNHSKFLVFNPGVLLLPNIKRTNYVIAEITGKKPRFFRPPYGLRSPLMTKRLKKSGYIMVLWDNSTKDYKARKQSFQIVEDIFRKIKPETIIALHDGRDNKKNYSRENVIGALPELIDKITQEGYEIVPLSILLNASPYF